MKTTVIIVGFKIEEKKDVFWHYAYNYEKCLEMLGFYLPNKKEIYSKLYREFEGCDNCSYGSIRDCHSCRDYEKILEIRTARVLKEEKLQANYTESVDAVIFKVPKKQDLNVLEGIFLFAKKISMKKNEYCEKVPLVVAVGVPEEYKWVLRFEKITIVEDLDSAFSLIDKEKKRLADKTAAEDKRQKEKEDWNERALFHKRYGCDEFD